MRPLRKFLLPAFAAAAFAAASAPALASSFDLVGEDTDLFSTNPNIPAEIPNVLIVLDNTSNWSAANQNWPTTLDPACTAAGMSGSKQGDAEACAIYITIAKLNTNVNVGLMLFNDKDSGGFIQFPVSSMTSTNISSMQTALASVSTTNPALKTSASTHYTNPMNDVFRYLNSFGTYANTISPYPTGVPSTLANVSAYTDSTEKNFNFGALSGSTCGYNYIIWIGNGFPTKDTGWVANPPAGGAADLVNAAALLNDTNVTFGTNNQQLIPIQSTGSNADVWSKFLFNYGVKIGTGAYRHVTTYTVDVCNAQCDPNQATLLQSMANVSQGKYYQTSTLSAIEAALSQIFAQVQAVNSVFAATTLPVSINVRGTNLNQVYIGVFRPDATASPRWFGNLKEYQLGVDPATGSLQLQDVNNVAAVNLNTGFISNTATSFWTSTYNAYGTSPAEGFWFFRGPSYAATDVGQDQDAPDGDLVEKGGNAERIRINYPMPDSTTAQTRNIYTCTGTCAAGSTLSSYPFNDANTDITSAALGTFQQLPVSPLTASGTTATATTSSAHGFAVGNVVTMSGAVPSLFDGNFTIVSVPSSTTFTYTLTSTPDTTHAFVTEPGYVLTPGKDLVTVSGATPSDYNVTNAAISAVAGNPNQYSYVLATSPVGAASGYSVTGVRQVQASGGTSYVLWSSLTASNNVTVTLPTHGYSSGDTVSISGATDSAFNTSGSVITKVDANTFTYTTTGTPAGAAVNSGIATLSGSMPAGWGNGITVQISGVTSCTGCTTPTNFNTVTAGSAITGVTGSQFQYSTSGTVSGSATVTGVVAKRIVASDTSTWTVSSAGVGTGSTLQFTLSRGKYSGQFLNALTTASSVTIANCSYTAKITGKNTVVACSGSIASVGNTASSTSDPGANNWADMNSGITINITPANTNSLTCCSVTTTAAGTAPLTNATTITWTGQTISAGYALSSINQGPATVSAAGTIYASKSGDLTSAVTSIANQSVATGTISAGLATNPDPAERTHLIYWVRGQDNMDDENKNGDLSTCVATNSCDVRSSVHGDVLHSRPAVVNYNRNSTATTVDNNDVYVYYGSNDGLFRSIKGGQATDGTAGNEQWAFVAPEFFGKLKRLRNQSPSISSTSPKDYFFDGPIGVYTLDANQDGKYTTGSSGDKVYLFLSMRRGGRMIYALDVTDPTNPKLLWKHGCTNPTGTGSAGGCDAGWDAIGQTWSQPEPVYLRAFKTAGGADTLALVFAAGYDAPAEVFQPCVITAYSSTSVTALTGVAFPNPMTATNCPPSSGTSTTVTRTMGRGIFFVNATTGDILWRIGPDASANTVVPGMTYSMPADLAILRNRNNTAARSPSIGIENVPLGYMDRIYAPDTGGNVWRIDVADPDPATWVVNQFVSIAPATGGPSTTTGSPAATNMRKFEFQPDVVYTSDANGAYDAVLLGSGDREHPFDQIVGNSFFMFKDRNIGTLYSVTTAPASPLAGASIYGPAPLTAPATILTPTAITESSSPALDNITTDLCLQNASLCVAPETQASAMTTLVNAPGWQLDLANTGEKTIAPGTTAANTVIFNTNQPKQDTVSGTAQNVGTNAGNFCTSDLGTARQYGVNFQTGSAANIYNNLPAQYVPSAGYGRYAVFAGGGFLPEPVPAVVQIGGKYYQTIISGVEATNPGGLSLQRRVRTYWFKKVD